eukprot:1331961-Pyramimonas_sp.AAC.1
MGCGPTAPGKSSDVSHRLCLSDNQITDHRTQEGPPSIAYFFFVFCDARSFSAVQVSALVCSAQTDCSPIYLAHIAHSLRVTFETSKIEGQLFECTPLPLILENLNFKSRDILRNVR